MEKLKFAGICFIVLCLMVCAFYFGTNRKSYSTVELITDITQNTKLIDANTDHNQALDVAEYAKKKNIEIPPILINFDTHSDMYLNYPVIKYGAVGVENWINEYLVKYPEVKELYWVMPKEEALNFPLQMLFAEDDYRYIMLGCDLYGNSLMKNINLFKFIFTPLTKKAFEQNFKIDKNGTLNEYIANNPINKVFFRKSTQYRKIKIITCTVDTLPDFKGKRVFLSIDADYVSNSGFDTTDNFKINKSSKGIDYGFYNVLKSLKTKNIYPEIISMSLSPQYLPNEHHRQVQNIFEYIINISGLSDEIQTYTRHYADNPNYLNKIYENLYNAGLLL